MRTPLPAACFFTALILVGSTPLFLGSTCSQQQLAPGPYQGDTLLARYDQVIIDVNDTFKAIIGVADRNPAVVAANPELSERVAKLRAEFDGVAQDDETLVRLIRARNAYVAAKSAVTGQALEGELTAARTALETARALLPLFVQPES